MSCSRRGEGVVGTIFTRILCINLEVTQRDVLTMRFPSRDPEYPTSYGGGAPSRFIGAAFLRGFLFLHGCALPHPSATRRAFNGVNDETPPTRSRSLIREHLSSSSRASSSRPNSRSSLFRDLSNSFLALSTYPIIVADLEPKSGTGSS